MKKQTRRKPVGLHPIEKQKLRATWDSHAVRAQIHALIGEDRERLLDFGSLLLFVACACALHLGWTGDEPDMRVVRGSINGLDEMAKRKTISDVDRKVLHNGMLAAHRIIEATPIEVVLEAAAMFRRTSNEWKGAN